MPWSTVLEKIIFWDPKNPWPLAKDGTVSVVSDTDQAAIIGYLERLYSGSSTAAGMLDTWAAAGPIRIGQSGPGNPAFAGGTVAGGGAYLGLNLGAIDGLHYFNRNGTLVKEKPELTIIHEVSHLLGTSDPAHNLTAMNGVSFDFDGDTVRKQNVVARELGFTDNHQVSYGSALLRGVDTRFAEFEVGKNYSYGKQVDIVRIGDAPDVVDNMDLSSRTDKKTSLMFGLSGDDVLRGSDGVDFLYGGSGVDQLFGNGGDDYLVFDTTDRRVDGGAGFDTAVLTSSGVNAAGKPLGAEFNPSRLGLRDVERVYGTEGDDTITISGSGFVVDGAGGNDRFKLSGSGAITIEFRSGGGHDFVDGLFLPRASNQSWIEARQNDTIKFVDVLPSEVSLVWNFTESTATGSWGYRIGTFSIKINSTGDSISFGELYAQVFYYKNAPGDLSDSDVWVRYETNRGEYDRDNVYYTGTDGDVSSTDGFYHFDLFEFKDGSRYSITDLFELDKAVSGADTSAAPPPVQTSASLSANSLISDEVNGHYYDEVVFSGLASAWHHAVEIV